MLPRILSRGGVLPLCRSRRRLLGEAGLPHSRAAHVNKAYHHGSARQHSALPGEQRAKAQHASKHQPVQNVTTWLI